jgi:hypothetical protein
MQHVFDEHIKFKRGDLVAIDGYPNNLEIGIFISDYTTYTGYSPEKKPTAYARVFLNGSIQIYAKFTLKHIL